MTPKSKPYVECECGARIYGSSLKHAERNLPAHQGSKRHEELMQIKKRKQEKQNDAKEDKSEMEDE